MPIVTWVLTAFAVLPNSAKFLESLIQNDTL